MYYSKFPGPKYLLFVLVCLVVAVLMFGPGHQDADKYNANNSNQAAATATSNVATHGSSTFYPDGKEVVRTYDANNNVTSEYISYQDDPEYQAMLDHESDRRVNH